MTDAQRPPLPPFTSETAAEKVRLAEDGWNSRDPATVALAYTVDSQWRNRAEFVNGREAIAQKALIKSRVEYGLGNGVSTFVVEALAPVGGEPNISFDNLGKSASGTHSTGRASSCEMAILSDGLAASCLAGRCTLAQGPAVSSR